MTKPKTLNPLDSPPEALRKQPLFAVLLLLLVVAYVFLSFIQTKPPQAAPEGIAATEFSSGRALKHIEVIAQHPHPVGSSEHDRVRDYIVQELAAMGVRPEVQKTMVAKLGWQTHLLGATVENIIGVLKGTQSGKTVMLASHYDSALSSPGASDDGCGVAAMLECLRALKASEPLKNDVVFLFTDGEETGLLGAKAFVDEHPLVKDVGLVLNFETRGNRGASILFETSPENGALIREFAKAAPYPVATSGSYALYKLLPNDTDMTVFKGHGLAGLNFAYIEGATHYHTAKDDVGSVDLQSLQRSWIIRRGFSQTFRSPRFAVPERAGRNLFQSCRFTPYSLYEILGSIIDNTHHCSWSCSCSYRFQTKTINGFWYGHRIRRAFL